MSSFDFRPGYGQSINLKYCAASVHDSFSVGFHQCISKPKRGSRYCGTHDPEAVKRRSEKSNARVSAFMAELNLKGEIHEAQEYVIDAARRLKNDANRPANLLALMKRVAQLEALEKKRDEES